MSLFNLNTKETPKELFAAILINQIDDAYRVGDPMLRTLLLTSQIT